MKKKLLTLMMMAALVLSGVCGMGMPVSAANTSDTEFSFDNRNTTGLTGWRSKENNTKVYIYPKSGPSLRYRIRGRKDGGTAAPCSNWVNIPLGVQASVTNTVREDGYNQARVKMERTMYAQVWTKGVWSPDSTKTYTVFN